MAVLTLIPSALLAIGILSLFEALYSLKGGVDYLRLFQTSRHQSPGDFAPSATLILPFKGVDKGLQENLTAYFELDYPDLQILLVTEDSLDPCVPILERVREGFPAVTSQILFAGKAQQRGQKVHNLLHAVGQLGDGDGVLAFGDSDIRPAANWLRDLIGTLEDPDVGVSTGFRWYLPQRGNFASVLRSVWNAGTASLMKEGDSYFAWGGAMAVRREVFQDCQVVDYWTNALSDDYAISRAIHDHSRTIRFQPRCLSFSHEDCRLHELLEWSGRQLSITHIYHPNLWRLAFVSQTLNSLTLWGGMAFLLMALWNRTLVSNRLLLGFAVVLALVYGLGCLKGWIRVRAVTLLFPEHTAVLRKYRWAYTFWGPLASLLSLWGFIRSLWSRTIEWRGIRYRMVSPKKTVVFNDRQQTGRED
ncbi:MAG: glycosyltransferase [Acidobacteria bacterium]|nr:glycosyltransferase [Acidobacteriota bacterium]